MKKTVPGRLLSHSKGTKPVCPEWQDLGENIGLLFCLVISTSQPSHSSETKPRPLPKASAFPAGHPLKLKRTSDGPGKRNGLSASLWPSSQLLSHTPSVAPRCTSWSQQGRQTLSLLEPFLYSFFKRLLASWPTGRLQK